MRGIHDILRHILDVSLNMVAGQTDLIHLSSILIFHDKLSSFKHTGFDESLPNGMWLLCFAM